VGFFYGLRGREFIMATPYLSTCPQHRKPNETIKKELKKRGISQIQAAFDLSLHRSDFCLIANGYLIPKPETCAKIAKYLGLPEETLFNQVGE
jgi:DNA-binding XRE family transcriptional regulator